MSRAEQYWVAPKIGEHGEMWNRWITRRDRPMPSRHPLHGAQIAGGHPAAPLSFEQPRMSAPPIHPDQTDRMHSSELLPVVVRRRAFTLVARVSKKVHVLSAIVDRANGFESFTYMNCTRGEKDSKRVLGQNTKLSRFSIVERRALKRRLQFTLRSVS